MARKARSLKVLLYSFPISSVAVILNTIIVCYVGSTQAQMMWQSTLPGIMTILTLLGAAAGVGPLVADNIKAKAGLLGKEE